MNSSKVNLAKNVSNSLYLTSVSQSQSRRQINVLDGKPLISDNHEKTWEKLISMRSAATDVAKLAINEDIETLKNLASTINDLGSEIEVKKHELSNLSSKIAKAKETLAKINRQVEKGKNDLAKKVEENEALLASMKSASRKAQVQLMNDIFGAGRNALGLLFAEFQTKLAKEWTQGSSGDCATKEIENDAKGDEKIVDKEGAANHPIEDELSNSICLSDQHSYHGVPLSSTAQSKTNPIEEKEPVVQEDCEEEEPNAEECEQAEIGEEEKRDEFGYNQKPVLEKKCGSYGGKGCEPVKRNVCPVSKKEKKNGRKK